MRHDTPAYLTRWPGWVELPAALNYPQLVIWQDAVDAMLTLGDDLTWNAAASNPRTAQHLVKALCALVTEWHLENLPERVSVESFPATPRVQSALLVAWLSGLLGELFTEADEPAEKKAA
jgi:hypothetical protein